MKTPKPMCAVFIKQYLLNCIELKSVLRENILDGFFFEDKVLSETDADHRVLQQCEKDRIQAEAHHDFSGKKSSGKSM